MSEEKEVKRGYVKWTDADGVFHKEPLADHADLLAAATPEQQLQAEEVRRLNAAAEESTLQAEIDAEDNTEEVLEALKAAPEDILTAAQLQAEEGPVVEEAEEPVAPASGAESAGEKTEEVADLQFEAASPITDPQNEHEEALAELYKNTTTEE